MPRLREPQFVAIALPRQNVRGPVTEFLLGAQVVMGVGEVCRVVLCRAPNGWPRGSLSRSAVGRRSRINHQQALF
jgi:hypothetical protein